MTNLSRRKVLYYCLSLVGIGHLTASLQVIRELLKQCDVDLIYGGQEIDIAMKHPGLRITYLPNILIDNTTGELYDPGHQYSVEQLWTLRNEHIIGFLRFPYDALIVEFFPFGRRRFKKEIHALFQLVREQNKAIPIFSFVREVLVPEALETEQRMVQSVKDYIHTVFIRGDPNVIRFDESFSLTYQIADKLRYIGYLGVELPEHISPRKSQILISQGGGNVGRDLLEAAIRTAPLMPDYFFLIATGSKTTAADFAHFTDMISSVNVKVVPFLQNFKDCLLESALSISMGGDNTLMDVISTRTPGLAFPYPGNLEQETRIQKLAAKGFIQHLTTDDLSPERLRSRILDTMVSHFPDVKIMMDGAARMSREIHSILTIDNKQ